MKRRKKCFGQYLKNGKIYFPLYFQNVIWPGGDIFFHRNSFLKKPNTWVKLDCVEAPLSPNPIITLSSFFLQIQTHLYSIFSPVKMFLILTGSLAHCPG